MKHSLKIVLFVLLLCGVFGADEVKPVMEGDSVTLIPDLTEIQGINKMQWRFGNTIIAQIKGTEILNKYEDIFKDRLQLDHQTGSMTIKNMRIKHSGLYQLQIYHNTGTPEQNFTVAVYESPSVIEAGETELKSVSVKEGDPVTLDVPQIQGDELIVWRFGDEEKLIAKHDLEAKSSSLYYEEERFRDRLQLNDQTGSLTIINTGTNHSGLYKVKISSNKQTLYKRFTVTVIPGVSPGAVAGIVVAVLLAAAVAGVMYFYLRPRTTNLPNQTLPVQQLDSVTLKPETEIQTGDEIQWLFGDKDALIAETKGETREMNTNQSPDERFKNRLKLDETTGSLTITDIRTEHDGLYTLKIRRGRETLYKRFYVYVVERMIRVMEGKPVKLNPDPEIQTGDEILWLFGYKDALIAEIKEENREMNTNKGPDERFKNRLELDKMTWSLTITDITTEDTGLYTLKIRGGRETFYQRFHVSVVERTIRALEGDLVKLNPETEIQTGDEIQWLFGVEDTLIAEIKGENREMNTNQGPDERFKNRLKLDETTGSLIITDIRTEHIGRYTLKIIGGRETLYRRFHIYVKKRMIRVMEGKPVKLNPDTEIQKGDVIQLLFGDEDTLIAEIKGETREMTPYEGPDERFKNRLELDETTGSLIITDITTEDTGLYTLKIRGDRETLYKRFHVFVRAREKSLKEKNDSRENRVNESATVVMPLLDGDYVNVVNEEEGTSSL